MSTPRLYDKSRWDVATGLDYSGPSPDIFEVKYSHHEFPPLFENTELVSRSDLGGRGDAGQLVKLGHYVYVGHLFSGGLSVVDVKDPVRPEVVAFIPTDSPHVWSEKCRAVENILVVNNEWKFFEPERYQVRAQYPDHMQRGPKEPIETGVKIYDISKPTEPKLLSFFKTGQWSLEGGGSSCHRFWFDGHYAYLSADTPGYNGRIMRIVDLTNPKEPREVSRFWMAGQWIAGGERPWWPDRFPGGRCHHPVVQGNRAYVTWFALGGAILDISNIRVPTLISEFNWDFGGQNHTFMPIKDRQFAVFTSEFRHGYMMDISNEKYPKLIGTFPRPPKGLSERGACHPFGPGLHNIHENQPGEDSFRSDDIIYATAGCGGLRVYDVSDPYRVREIGYYVPGTPKVYYSPYGAGGGRFDSGVQATEVFVDKKGLVYCSLANGGLEILEFTG